MGEIKDIYDYLNELARCEWHNNAIIQGIKYNGIDINQGTETYYTILSGMRNKAEQALLTLSTTGQDLALNAIYGKVIELLEQPVDIISQSAVDALKEDFPLQNRTQAIQADIELGQFIIDMRKVQLYYIKELTSFMRTLLHIPTGENSEAQQATETKIKDIVDNKEPQQKPDKRVIKGVKGLKAHLGIGLTKAQEILNSGILQKRGIAYKNGKAWRINAEKLDNLLANEPYIFGRKLTKDFDL